MARKKLGKASHKTLRLTAENQFAVDFWSQALGQSATGFMEKACAHYADTLAKKHDNFPWRKIWHIEPAVRELRLFMVDEYPLSDEQQRTRHFVVQHADFFYARGEVNIRAALALFPRLDEFRGAKGDVWEPGRLMAEALKSQGIAAPVWPPKDAR